MEEKTVAAGGEFNRTRREWEINVGEAPGDILVGGVSAMEGLNPLLYSYPATCAAFAEHLGELFQSLDLLWL